MFLDTDPEEIRGPQTNREVTLGRHRVQCTICKHQNRKEIEDAWLNWSSPAKIEYDYQISRDSLYRHCHAFNLFAKRRTNILGAYERIIERQDTISFTGSNVLSALGTYVKMLDAEKTAEDVQPADSKPGIRQASATEGEDSAPDSSQTESSAEKPDAEPGQAHNEGEEPQCPEPTTVQ